MKTEAPGLVHAMLVHIPAGEIVLEAELTIPPHAAGLVIFAHGSGSSRLSPRNGLVARKLQSKSLATLLVDLLTEAEDSAVRKRFNIDLLTERLKAITDWAAHGEQTERLPIGYFGASTGAAAAIRAAAIPDMVQAVVSRGGRVDLAQDTAASLTVPTLLVVGQEDYGVLEANETTFLLMPGPKKIAIIPKATHLFEEPGALERVADLAASWFAEHLTAVTERLQRGRRP